MVGSGIGGDRTDSGQGGLKALKRQLSTMVCSGVSLSAEWKESTSWESNLGLGGGYGI